MIHFPHRSTAAPEPSSVDAIAFSNWWNTAGVARVHKIDTQGVITTVAGAPDGAAGFAGDNGPATNARFNNPNGLAIDNIGNTYIADMSNHRIRKIDNTGTITTIAGNGQGRSSGDGGLEVNSEPRSPTHLVLDAVGNLYISEQYRIRKIDMHGVIMTVVGNGTYGSSGDGGPATNAQLTPKGLGFDQLQNLYVADADNNRVRKIDTNGIITTIAGSSTAGFAGDNGTADLYESQQFRLSGQLPVACCRRLG